nr:DsrE family protein [uncultured Holophaga sp.]
MSHNGIRNLAMAALILGSTLGMDATTPPSSPQESMDSLVLSMSTDRAPLFEGALDIASVALKRGHPVTLLLRLDAIKVAVARNSYPVRDTSLAARLSAFMGAGGKVIAGGGCMKDMGLTPRDLLPGVTVGTPDLVMGTLFRKDTKILSY